MHVSNIACKISSPVYQQYLTSTLATAQSERQINAQCSFPSSAGMGVDTSLLTNTYTDPWKQR